VGDERDIGVAQEHDKSYNLIMDDPITQKPKLLIAHQNPDLDAIGAMWLFLRFDEQRFEEAQLYFVNAGEEISDETLGFKELSREEVVHVDTGMGPFDHHQPGNQTRNSATLLVYQYLGSKYSHLKNDEALRRLVDFVNENDHFASCYWPEATSDRYVFMMEDVLKGIKQARHLSDREVADLGLVMYDGVYNSMKMKVKAEEAIAEGTEFESPWGKSLFLENKNDDSMKLAMKMGYQVVVRRNRDSNHVRIKAVPSKQIDLTRIYEEIMKRDQIGTWYLHPSKAMLLNGSEHNESHVATPLSLHEVVEIVTNTS
jgi:hypothetical protein